MGSKKQLPACPECERLHAVADKSNACGEFLSWLHAQGYVLAKRHEHDDNCGFENGFRQCGYHEDELAPHYEDAESLLARFFNIDLNKVERERRALLAAVSEAQYAKD